MSFDVTLPSNASMQTNPENKLRHFFKIKLSQTIDMTSKYEEGLVEFQFPDLYFNVLGDEVLVFERLPTINQRNRGWKCKPPVLTTTPVGLYDSVETFIDKLNKMLMASDAIMVIYFNKASKSVSIK